MIDVLVENGTIITQDSDRRILDDGAVAIRDDEIVRVGRRSDVVEGTDVGTVIDATGHAVLPGLINTHTHVPDILFRGLGDSDKELFDWLYTVKIPGEAVMEKRHHAVASALYCEEAIRSGITTFVENASSSGSNRDAIIEKKLDVYETSGIRNVYAQSFIDKPPVPEISTHIEEIIANADGVVDVDLEGAIQETDTAIRTIERTIQEYHGTAEGRQSVWPAPAVVESMTAEGLCKAYELAAEYDVMTTTHVSENEIQEHAHRSCIDRLHDIGYLGEHALLAHCVHADDRDIRLLAQTGTNVAHNPMSNLRLGSGIAPIPGMRRAGVDVGLGTDNPMLSDTVNLVNDMRFSSLVPKGAQQDPGVILAQEALDMATIDAAKTINRADELGSIEVGKKADLVLLDLDYPHLKPTNDLISTIVYQAQGYEIESVICNGEIVLDGNTDRTPIETQLELLPAVKDASREIAESAGLSPQ